MIEMIELRLMNLPGIDENRYQLSILHLTNLQGYCHYKGVQRYFNDL